MPDRLDTDTQPLKAAQPASEGWVLAGRYRVLDQLGRGGMADVFRAHDELLDRDVAVKVFRTVPIADGDTHGEVRREMELQSLAQLSHPNLTTLFDGSVAGDDPAYLVLELVDGPDLATRLHDGALSESEARQLGAQIAEALAYVHAHGMIHRDVKPANILLGTDGSAGGMRARLSDFGIVRMVGSERMTAANLTLGTASYIAPEQARGANVEPPADVYSLGLVLIEALSGVRCFDGPLHEALAARLATSPTVPGGLPEPWPALLAAMTATNPAQRPSAAEVAESLRVGTAPAVRPVAAAASAASPAAAVLADPSPTGWTTPLAPASDVFSPVEPVGHRHGPPRRGRLAVVLAAITFVALLGGAGVLLLGSSEDSPGAGVSTTPTVHRSVSSSARHHTSQAVEVQGSSTTHGVQSSTSAAPVRSTSSVVQQSTSAARSSVSPSQSASTSASASTATSTSSTPTTAAPDQSAAASVPPSGP